MNIDRHTHAWCELTGRLLIDKIESELRQGGWIYKIPNKSTPKAYAEAESPDTSIERLEWNFYRNQWLLI